MNSYVMFGGIMGYLLWIMVCVGVAVHYMIDKNIIMAFPIGVLVAIAPAAAFLSYVIGR